MDRFLARRRSWVGAKSRHGVFEPNVRGLFKTDGVGDFSRSRAFEFRRLSIRQFRVEPILILEFTIRVARLAV
jgi:hypothetical protein